MNITYDTGTDTRIYSLYDDNGLRIAKSYKRELILKLLPGYTEPEYESMMAGAYTLPWPQTFVCVFILARMFPATRETIAFVRWAEKYENEIAPGTEADKLLTEISDAFKCIKEIQQ